MLAVNREPNDSLTKLFFAYNNRKEYTSTTFGSSMSDRKQAESWIGASLLRKEDARHLQGRGMFIADISIPGLQDIAFVRSQVANGNVRQVTKPPGSAGTVFTMVDIGPI